MKNKGFTLIELLAVIAVLAVIGTIIIVNLSSTFRETNEENCESFVTDIEDAACVYAGLSTKSTVCNRTSCPPIKLSTLLSEGLIEEEKDACTGKNMDLTQTVTVEWDSEGQKICTYNGVKTYEG